jgi:hypothetical protein
VCYPGWIFLILEATSRNCKIDLLYGKQMDGNIFMSSLLLFIQRGYVHNVINS